MPFFFLILFSFFEKISDIATPDYIPYDQDILRCRTETIGVSEVKITIQGIPFEFIDVAGQRGNRKKYLSLFSEVNAIFFVAAINEYDLFLKEDLSTNRMREALQLFEEIVNNKELEEVPIILFLNKVDLFEEKIARVPLTVCFPEYKGNDRLEMKLIHTPRFTISKRMFGFHPKAVHGQSEEGQAKHSFASFESHPPFHHWFGYCKHSKSLQRCAKFHLDADPGVGWNLIEAFSFPSIFSIN
jgi:hypothetical protein